VDWDTAAGLALRGGLGAAGFMIVLWLVQLRTRNAGIVDFGWAAVLGSLAVFYAVSGPGWAPRRFVLALLGGLWGYRLAWYLLRQRIWRQPEEGRYVTLRGKWKSPLDVGFLLFFEAQAVLALVLSLPFLFAAFDGRPVWTLPDGLAVGLWLIGWVGEAAADRQLARWKANPAHRGKTCREGLWRYSRHPNYFFEWIIWCGFGILGLGVSGSWLGLIAPALMLLFILKITGIPPTEAQALRSRGEDYRRYQETTSPFIPWFPRKEVSR
jgi:steroid 5-alpha reductase family enzyme